MSAIPIPDNTGGLKEILFGLAADAVLASHGVGSPGDTGVDKALAAILAAQREAVEQFAERVKAELEYGKIFELSHEVVTNVIDAELARLDQEGGGE